VEVGVANAWGAYGFPDAISPSILVHVYQLILTQIHDHKCSKHETLGGSSQKKKFCSSVNHKY